jgi:hypothetical protein
LYYHLSIKNRRRPTGMPRILLLILLLFAVCFVLMGQESDFMPSQARQKHNFHLVAPKGAYVSIKVYLDGDFIVGNKGIVPNDSELKEFHKDYYSGREESFDTIGFVENAVSFAELKNEYKKKLLRIEVTVTLAHNKEEFADNFADNVIIEDLWDCDIYVDNNGEIEIMLSLG